MDKITITRALTELKLLDARIIKLTGSAKFVDLFQNKRDIVLINNMTKEVFETKAKASMQSIEDLIKRREKIKSAIMLSNAVTSVEIGRKKYFVIEAISRKTSINYEVNLLQRMKHEITNAKHQVDQQKPQLDQNVKELVEKNLGGDKKPSKEDYDVISDPFLKANKLNIIDPCGVEKRIDEMDEKIDNFLAEVDFVLSESNAKTEIEV